ENGQRMTPVAIAKRQPTLEVHLPEQVWCRLLEPSMGASAARRHGNAIMPAQDFVHRRDRRAVQPVTLQAACDLASSPGRMSIAHRQNTRFDRVLRPHRTRMRTPGPVREFPIGHPAAKPLVAGGRMNPSSSTELSPVRPFLHRQPHKLTPLIHDRHLLPWHGWPPKQPNPCNDYVSAMSPNTRRLMCPG